MHDVGNHLGELLGMIVIVPRRQRYVDVQTGLAGRLDKGCEPKADQQIAQPQRDSARLLEPRAIELRLGARLFLAGKMAR